MAEHKIEPHRVTKPIQLLAAWLVGLVLVDAMFLAAALQLEAGWERGCLIGFAILNVPLFLAAIFVLQTKFRAELQEDTFYSEYLSKKTSAVVKVDTPTEVESRLEVIERHVAALVGERKVAEKDAIQWGSWRIALNEFHPRFHEIRGEMRKRGVPLAEVFGGKGYPNSQPPKQWVVSINVAMPLRLKSELLSLAMQFEFEGFQLWTPVPEAEETEDVYFGSYGSDTEDFVVITPELGDLLQQGMEEADLSLYIRRHDLSVPP
jgi:hypothetical protein